MAYTLKHSVINKHIPAVKFHFHKIHVDTDTPIWRTVYINPGCTIIHKATSFSTWLTHASNTPVYCFSSPFLARVYLKAFFTM